MRPTWFVFSSDYAGRNLIYLVYQPETAANKDGEVALGNTGPVPTALVSSAAGAAGSLAGWAISSISKKVRCGLWTRQCAHWCSKITASDMQAPILGSQVDGSKTTQDSSSIHYAESYRGDHSAYF
jgi:hypothetical protein